MVTTKGLIINRFLVTTKHNCLHNIILIGKIQKFQMPFNSFQPVKILCKLYCVYLYTRKLPL